MKRIFFPALALSFVGSMLIPAARAATVDVGYMSYDITSPGSAEFDIGNLTGSNSSGTSAFPITTSLALSSLSLTVTFASGPSEVFGPSYFTLGLDGLSFNGGSESNTTGQPSGFLHATGATLTGDFSTTSVTLFDGTSVTIDPTFSAAISDPSGLANGDSTLISTSTHGSGPPPPVPEPESLVLVGSGLAALAALRRRFRLPSAGRIFGGVALLLVTGALAFSPATASAATAVKLTGSTLPSSGLAGVTTVHITATGVPAGAVPTAGVTVSIAPGCMGGSPATTHPSSIIALPGGAGYLIYFQIPEPVAGGTYQVSVTGTAGGTAFASSNCSALTVTKSNPSLASCVPTSSIAVTVGTNVTVYIPYGWWGSAVKNVASVNIEGSSVGSSTVITTPGTVNSCAADSAATPPEVVCTENTKNIDIITGTTLKSTITSDSNASAGFSGGSCQNCGVAIDAASNKAVIAMGLSGGSGSGVQAISLIDNSKLTPFPLRNYVSEDVSVDPGSINPAHKWILSPAEDGIYDILKIDTAGGSAYNLTEYGNRIGGTLDSAAEDCTTAIALSSDEFTDSIYITDLSQATFTAGTPGTWTAPGQFVNLSDAGYAAGTSGITSAPGTAHLAAVTGEFGGQAYSVLQLPAKSGTGIPSLVDYAYVSTMPNTPDGNPFSAGFDPHTITAYTSPNGLQKSYVLFVDYYPTGYPTYLAQVDMGCVLAAPRTAPGGHLVTAGGANSCVKYFKVPTP